MAVAEIEWAVVPGNQRLNILPKYFGVRLMMRAESTVYGVMQRLCKAYAGGYWEYVEATNGAFFMYPDSKTALVMESPNGTCRAVSSEAAGIVATLFALGALSTLPNEEDSEKASELYHLLRDVAKAHEEWEPIMALID